MPKPSHQDTILDAGLRIFHRRGFNASGVQDVVSEAGVPKGSFYNHFPSKEALGVAVLERYWDLAADGRAALDDQSVRPLDRLDRHFECLGFPEDGCLLGNFSAELAMHETFRQALLSKWRAWAAALARCLADGQRDGSVRADIAPAELARDVLALWEGAVLMSRVERSPGPLADARKTIRRLISR